ncbi:Thioesterase-like superfamily/Acyl-CoA thioesterase, putative [Angomonas deanei]|uniref:Thioesterase-like superfamily/Acyl-CoA thioesterase, putative n=1 Tax=Angomonas deanei TaxID=59799 RepID=A0A7G2CT95_9TRYP|nr:Thioesterase-like superfamily/Acyl-CoA thioesterase, putative [Angomonas deanei]
MTTGEEGYLSDFALIPFDALVLDTVDSHIFQSKLLWTPQLSVATYGGQLVAHAVESAYRAIEGNLRIHSLQVSFMNRGISEDPTPITYRVQRLKTGRSVSVRGVEAFQGTRRILYAIAGFHKVEEGGLQHNFAQPHFVTSPAHTAEEMHAREQSIEEDRTTGSGRSLPVARVHFKHIHAFTTCKSRSHDIWFRLGDETLVALSAHTNIPLSRLHLVLAAWLSDFTVALSVFLSHERDVFDHLNLIASLNHTLYFHDPTAIRVNEWMLLDVSSPWSSWNRGLTEGKCFNAKGQLCFTAVQENIVRTSKPFRSNL